MDSKKLEVNSLVQYHEIQDIGEYVISRFDEEKKKMVLEPKDTAGKPIEYINMKQLLGWLFLFKSDMVYINGEYLDEGTVELFKYLQGNMKNISKQETE